MPSYVFSDHPFCMLTIPSTVCVAEAGELLVVEVSLVVEDVVLVVLVLASRKRLANILILWATIRNPVSVPTAVVVVLVESAAGMEVVACRYVKGTSTKGISVVKKCGFLFFVVEATSLAVNVTGLVVEAADVALLVADVVFADLALVSGVGGAAGAGADEPQKSGPVPH
jgi:hypothetical protein